MTRFFDQLPTDEQAELSPRSERPREPGAAPAGSEGWKAQLLAIDGVVGVGSRRDAVVVYVRDDSVAASLPREVEGLPVKAEVTGEIQAK